MERGIGCPYKGGSQIMTSATVKPRVVKIYSIVYRCESVTVKGKFYTVIVNDGMPTSCNCPAMQYGKRFVCSHMVRVRESIELETVVDKSEEKETLTTIHSWKDDQYSY